MINTSAQNALKNSAYNFISFVLPIIVIIFITPIVISKWGPKEYGVYIFLNTVTVFLGLLDLGVSTANSKHIIEYKTKEQDDKLKKLIYSMNSVYAIMSIIYFIICFGIGIIIQTFFIERVGVGNNYLLIFFILGVTTAISALFNNFNNILITIQRYDLQVKIYVFFTLLSSGLMLGLVLLGYGIITVLMMQLAIAILTCVTQIVIVKKVFPIIKMKFAWDKTEIFRNYKFGFLVAFNNVANSSLVHFDKLLIPVFLGNAQLTYYSVPGSIATKISSVSTTLSTVLFPITVNLHSLNNIEKIKKLYIRSMRLILILSSAISLSIIFNAEKILLYWLDKSFVSQSLTVLILLVLTNFILALFNPLSNLLIAMGKMKFLTIGSFTMAIINLISLLILLPRYGINGAAFSYLISVLMIFAMFSYAEKKYFNIQKNANKKTAFRLLLTTVPFFIIIKLAISPLITSLLSLIILGPSSVIIFMLLYKILGFVEKEDQQVLNVFILKILKKHHDNKE